MTNEKKYAWGLWIIAAVLIALFVGLVLYTVDHKDLIAWFVRYRLIIAGAAVVILLGLGFIFQPRIPVRLELQRASKEQGAEPPKPVDPAAAAATKKAEDAVDRAKALKLFLKQKRWYRWAYLQPWVLVAGDSATVTALMPDLAEKGWLATDDAVLLWGALGTDARPDELWLRQIRRLRRNRPLDAIALLLDGNTPLPDSVHEKNPWGLHLARITEVLRWSAPVYVLDVADADAVHGAATPVTGCEFTRPKDAPAIEAALRDLRDRLADLGVHQLASNGDDAYAAELSARLDKRSMPLARWIVGLTDWQRRPLPVAGAFFAPLPADSKSDSASLPLWRYLADTARHTPGRRTLAHPLTIFSTIALALIGLWSAGMLVSGMNNAHEVMLTTESLQTLDRASDNPGRLRALAALQQRIG